MHRLRDREHLTVVMFHRVLPEDAQARVGADPTYTITPDLLAGCLDFFRQQYNLVSGVDLLNSRRGTHRLPPWPLMITFDDGWGDNFEWARTILRGEPWTVFVAVEAVRDPITWWQEALLWSLRSGRCEYSELSAVVAERSQLLDCCDLPADLRLLALYSSIGAERRKEALAGATKELSSQYTRAMMLSASEVQELHREGVMIGSHGAGHLPLTCTPQAVEDMKFARDQLCEILLVDRIPTLSFPHGRWDARLVGEARALGYELMFTSNAVLNPCPSGWLTSDVIGRIPIDCGILRTRSRTLEADRLATWLQNRGREGAQLRQSA